MNNPVAFGTYDPKTNTVTPAFGKTVAEVRASLKTLDKNAADDVKIASGETVQRFAIDDFKAIVKSYGLELDQKLFDQIQKTAEDKKFINHFRAEKYLRAAMQKPVSTGQALKALDTNEKNDVKIADGSIVQRYSKDEFKQVVESLGRKWDEKLFASAQQGVKEADLINFYRAQKYLKNSEALKAA